MGTVDYMAPEQGMSTKHADARADIYSLGCSLHYLLIGKPVYEGETITAKLVAHHNHPTPNLCQLRDTVPEYVQAVFSKMVEKKLEKRAISSMRARWWQIWNAAKPRFLLRRATPRRFCMPRPPTNRPKCCRWRSSRRSPRFLPAIHLFS